jgi:hypothetical protein
MQFTYIRRAADSLQNMKAIDDETLNTIRLENGIQFSRDGSRYSSSSLEQLRQA